MSRTLSRTLKEWRVNKGLTQQELAKVIQVSPSTYNSWENNPHKIQIEDAAKIAKGLNVDLDDIIFFDTKSNLKYVLSVEIQ